jgi:anti-sigma factor RsiW
MSRTHRLHPDKDCRSLLDSLSDYVDGTLSDNLCEELERHMSDCQDCRIVVNSLQKTVYLYQQTVENPEVPYGVRQRLFHSLDLDEFLNGE